MLAKVTLTVGALVVGIGLAFWSSDQGGEFGRARAVTVESAETAAVPQALADRLTSIEAKAGIRPDQQSAWREFTAAIEQLDAMTLAYDSRVAAGKTVDLAAEQTRHMLALGSAMTALDEALTPEQALVVRRLTEDLTKSMVCRGILDS